MGWDTHKEDEKRLVRKVKERDSFGDSVVGSDMNLASSGRCPMLCCCEHDMEISDSVKVGDLLNS
jgi:hypothetical protein